MRRSSPQTLTRRRSRPRRGGCSGASRSSGCGSRRSSRALGDWIGLIAILAIAARVSDNSGAAVSLVMVTRVVPGFFLGTVGGVIIDRFDRRKVMVMLRHRPRRLLLAAAVRREPARAGADLARPRDPHAAVGSGARTRRCRTSCARSSSPSANTLSLVASYGTFPLASIIFSLLAGLATVLGELDLIAAFKVDQEMLALVFDAMTFLVSAVDRVAAADPAASIGRRARASTGPRPSATSRKGCGSSASSRSSAA